MRAASNDPAPRIPCHPGRWRQKAGTRESPTADCAWHDKRTEAQGGRPPNLRSLECNSPNSVQLHLGGYLSLHSKPNEASSIRRSRCQRNCRTISRTTSDGHPGTRKNKNRGIEIGIGAAATFVPI